VETEQSRSTIVELALSEYVDRVSTQERRRRDGD